MNVDRPRQLDGEEAAARPSDVIELTRFLLHAARQTGASLVSIGVVGHAISFGDDGAGWTKAGFKSDLPARKLRQLLMTLAGEKIQITSSHKHQAWTTGLIAVGALEKARLTKLQLPITGTTVVFQVGIPIRDFDKLVQQARGSMSLEVKLNGRTIQQLPPSVGAD